MGPDARDSKGVDTVIYLRIIVGIALMLMAAFGPGVGFRRITNPNLDPRAAAKRHLDHRRATVLILRILAAMLGFWLLIFSIVQLLHGHGRLPH
jgi:multisubunit Na+/H+ antiporter MnhB subunit